MSLSPKMSARSFRSRSDPVNSSVGEGLIFLEEERNPEQSKLVPDEQKSCISRYNTPGTTLKRSVSVYMAKVTLSVKRLDFLLKHTVAKIERAYIP